MKLTLPQQDIYFEQLIHPNAPIYNIGAKILIEGIINITTFKKAYRCLIKQHDSYRTIFKNNKEEITSLVIENFEEELPVLDFSERENAEEQVITFMQREFIKPFDITSGKFLHKFILIKVTSERYYLFSVYHHIITDGWGTSLMFQRLVKNYNELIENQEVISKYEYSYKDFIVNDIEYQKSTKYQEDKLYWLKRFDVLPENIFEKREQNNEESKSAQKSIYIKRELYNSINKLAKEFKSSTFHVILATLFLYFGRKHQNNDYAIGLPVLNRGKAVFKRTVGLFMGISPLRIQMDFNSSFEKLLEDIRNQLRKDYRHQRFPLGKLIQGLNGFQEVERLFNITLSYEKQNYADHFKGTKTTVIPLSHQSERVGLAVYIREFDDTEDIKIDFNYNLNYFNEEEVTQITLHFNKLLDSILEAPNRKLYEFEYIPRKDKEQLQYLFNNTNIHVENDKTFLDVFNDIVKQYPNKIAIKDNFTELSYVEVQELSSTIAQNLLSLKEDTNLIGVLLNRSAYTIAVLLGVLKAGKSYIPLDPSFPKKRLQYIIDHSNLKTIISDQEEELLFNNCNSISLESIVNKVAKEKELALPKVLPSDTAYIIYTSGSTGNPKGVEIGHKSLLNFLLSIKEKPGVKPEDVLFAVTTYSFDISILEFFVPLISGASVYVASNKILEDYSKTIEIIQRVSPTIIQATPSFYQLLINGGWEGNKEAKLFCGGDLLSEDLAAQLLSNCFELWNMYGPTETTIWSSVKKITEKKEASNIGNPIANTQFYVLDSNLQFLPIGSNGVLYIGGEGLAKGYYKDAPLTTEKFIKNPHGEGLVYNTNDLVKWNEQGELIFLGRNDSQVKIRGYRIELGDIEDKLNQISQIQKAVVVVKKQQNQEAFLVAYIQKKDLQYNIQESISVLENELPEYMIPRAVFEIEEFPLTPNKKIDRKRLSEQTINVVSKAEEYPKTKMQKELALLWRKVLGCSHEISLKENFFGLGGHSLNAVKLSHEINKKYSVNIGLKSIFDHPTIGSLANFLENYNQEATTQIPQVASKEFYHVTPSQYKLWLASQTPDKLIAYNMVAAFNVIGNIDSNKINKAVGKLISENEILRTNFIEKRGEVYQKVKQIQEVDFTLSILQTTGDKVGYYIEKYINKPFNLEDDLLLRMLLIQTGSNTSALVFCTHHIIMDGISLEFFTNQLIENYQTGNAINNSKEIQFKDYSEWLCNSLETKDETEFYQSYLKDYQVKESIIVDVTYPRNETFKAEHYLLQFSLEETNSIKKVAREYQNTPYNVIVALINIISYVVSDHKDLIIGTVHSGRNIENIASIIGMFVKTLPLRTQLNDDISFLQLIEQVKEQLILLDRYQDIPASVAKEDLFDILVTFQNPDFSYQREITIEDIKLEYLPLDTNYARVPLLFNFFEVNSTLNLSLSYDIGRYEQSTILFIVDLFKELLSHLTKEPTLKISVLKDVLNEDSKQEELDFDFNF
ncbi:MAG: amino acid adenylation domain-containing protein [Tenacibaculum sp.]|uniref:amino acid adenylation domain-containing protein n=1 Tax=Tenacibaculum sp. TaxID=1906242 RepID=UPI001837096F|nr:amino acid adenylation domain-containing protein [Tenacibaculum sp.]NVK09321.1 amino acid adenylation domain-containing protein [Tenacibaculum sp.]